MAGGCAAGRGTPLGRPPADCSKRAVSEQEPLADTAAAPASANDARPHAPTATGQLTAPPRLALARSPSPGPDETFVPYLRDRLRRIRMLGRRRATTRSSPSASSSPAPASREGVHSHELRPHCEACSGVKGRATIEIEHPPGENPASLREVEKMS